MTETEPPSLSRQSFTFLSAGNISKFLFSFGSWNSSENSCCRKNNFHHSLKEAAELQLSLQSQSEIAASPQRMMGNGGGGGKDNTSKQVEEEDGIFFVFVTQFEPAAGELSEGFWRAGHMAGELLQRRGCLFWQRGSRADTAGGSRSKPEPLKAGSKHSQTEPLRPKQEAEWRLQTETSEEKAPQVWNRLWRLIWDAGLSSAF